MLIVTGYPANDAKVSVITERRSDGNSELPDLIRPSFTCLLLLWLAIASVPAAWAETWDITQAGEPGRPVSFTVEEGTWISVDVSPNGSTLVFDLLGDIYSLPAQGGEARLLRGGPALERQPRFSPDGRQIAFISDADGADNVWISDSDGERAKQLSAETLNRVSSPAWSSDGAYVAVTRVTTTVTEGFASALHLYHLAGGAGHILVPPPQPRNGVSEPVFTRDGSALFYTEDTFPGGLPNLRDANQPNYAIVRRNLASGASERIIQGYGSATTARISPDGRRIAFIRRIKDRTVLFVREISTGVETPVYDQLARDSQVLLGMNSGYGFYPGFSWFPDNRTVVIWGKGKLFRIDTATATADLIPFRVNAEHRIANALRFSRDVSPESFPVRAISGLTTSPATSPNGTRIVFSALGSLWRKVLPDGEPRRLTEAEEFEFDPQFSPDGREIAYVSWNDETGGALKVVAVGGGKGRTLYTSTGAVRGPVYSASADKLAFFIDEPSDLMGGYKATAGIYWIPARGGEAAFVVAGAWPVFAEDSGRLQYSRQEINPWGLSQDLHEVRLDGFDDRKLVTSTVGARDFVLSPNGQWLAYLQHGNIYLAPYFRTGSPVSMDATLDTPVRSMRVSRDSGWNLHWSSDSERVNWSLGSEYVSTPVERLFTGSAAAPRDTSQTELRTQIGLMARADPPLGSLALVNARIVTMQDDHVIESGTVLIEGNRIVAVGEDVAIPATAKQIDVAGKTVLPGLIDMHGHLTLYHRGLAPQKHAPYYAALAFGTTTNFDPSSGDLETARNTELVAAGRMVGPRLVGTGTIAPGYRGGSLHYPVDSLEDARGFARRKLALGFPALKSYMQPMRRQRQQLIRAAREQELMVFPEGEGNFYSQLTMILDGHTSIEHNNPAAHLYEDVLRLFSASGTAYTPTLVVTTGEIFGENYWFTATKPWEDPRIQTYVQNTLSSYSPFGGGAAQPPYVRGMISLHVDESLWESGVREVARSAKRASQAGVLVNAGSHGQIHGIGLHWELWLLAEGGMTPLEVLRTATMNPARTLGIDAQLGSIEPGKLADLIVLDGNPLENIRNSSTVRYTMVNGRLFDALTMNEIGNYDRPRTRFYWELPAYHGIDWNETFQGDDHSRFSGYPLHDH